MAIFRLVLLTVIVHMSCIANRVTCSLDALHHQASALEVGVMMALFALIPMLCAMRCGRWIDAAGPKKPLLLGISFSITASLIPTFLNTAEVGLWPLYLACMVNGVGLMIVSMTNQQLVGHLSDAKKRTTNFAMLAMGFSTANLLAPIASGYLIDGFDYQTTYAFALSMAATGFVFCLVFILRQVPAVWTSVKRPAGTSSFELFSIPRVRNVLIICSFMSMAWDLQGFMIPVYGKAIGLSATEIGWILGTFAMATFTVRLFMPFISRRLSEWETITTAFGLGALAYFLFPIFDNFYALCAVAFVLGLALGASQPNVMTLLHTETPQGRVGEANGLRMMIINACHTTLPIAFGAAGSVIGAGAVFFAVASLMTGVTWFSTKCKKAVHSVIDETASKNKSQKA